VRCAYLACCAQQRIPAECWVLSNQETTKLAWVIKGNVIHQCYIPSGESFVLIALKAAWCAFSRCCYNEYHMRKCWSLAIRKQQSLPGSSKMLYISVTFSMLESFCDLVPSGAGVLLACCAQQRKYLHECWSLSNQEAAKLAWVIKGNVYINVTACW
jgi:hypothetical protein